MGSGNRVIPRRTASCTALIPIPPSLFRPSSKLPPLGSLGPVCLGGLEHGRLAYRVGKTLEGRVFGSVVCVGLLAMTVLSLEEGLSLVELLIESEFRTRFRLRHSLWLLLLLLCTGLLLLLLLVRRVGDVVGDILGSKLEIIRSASSGEGGEYLPSGGTGSGCKGTFASSVG